MDHLSSPNSHKKCLLDELCIVACRLVCRDGPIPVSVLEISVSTVLFTPSISSGQMSPKEEI